MPRVLALFAMLAACDPTVVVDGDTDTAVDTAPPSRILEGGSYKARILGVAGTCGDPFWRLFVVTAPCDLIWVEDASFDLVCDGTSTSCSTTDGAVTCAGNTDEDDFSAYTPSGPTLLQYVRETDVNVTSTTSFERWDSIEFNCEGEGCAELIDDNDMPGFPCGLVIGHAYSF